jgi:hypothetical protein
VPLLFLCCKQNSSRALIRQTTPPFLSEAQWVSTNACTLTIERLTALLSPWPLPPAAAAAALLSPTIALSLAPAPKT